MRGLANQHDAAARRSAARSRPRAETRRGPARGRPCRGSNGSAARSLPPARHRTALASRGASCRVDHEDQARALAGQRHQRERPGLGVEFGRGVVVRAAMAEIAGQRGLRIGATARSRCRPPRGRASAARPRRSASRAATGRRPSSLTVTPIVARSRPPRRRPAISVSVRQRARTRVERSQQIPVLDIVAEGFEPDLARRKTDLRRAQEPCGVVDDPHDPQRRRLVAAALPDAERVERGDRACEQRGGAVVARTRPPGRPATVSTPALASAMAAVRPAGPPPTITTSAVSIPSCRSSAYATFNRGAMY